MQWLAWLESGWNGLEKSTCNALFLVIEDEEDGVTVGKQGHGWVVFDVRKLWKLFWGKTHDGNGRYRFKVWTCTKMEFVCNLWLEGVWDSFQACKIVS